jgi:ABC-2 type transport system permease protein
VTATAAPVYGAVSSSDPGFGATLRSEWTKLRSIRSTWIILGLALGLSIGFSALMALVTGLTYGDISLPGAFDPVQGSMFGMPFRIVLLVVFGVTAVTSEYSSGMIRTTFIANPRRARVFAAKAIVVGTLGVVVSAITALGMFLVSQPIFAAYGLETARLTDGDAARFTIVYSIVFGLIYTLIPLSLGFLLRGAASAITASVGFLFLPWMLIPVVPIWVQENVLRYLPNVAMDSLALAGMTVADAMTTHLSQTPAMVVIAVWLAGLLAAAAFALARRDV